MRPIILITSCNRDRWNGWQHSAEMSWYAEWHGLVDCKFVIGRGCEYSQPYELVVDEKDEYADVPAKNQAARKWALDHQYDYMFHACVDTWIHVPRLLSSEYGNNPCTGFLYGGNPSGGLGYWLSAKAAHALLLAPPAPVPEDVWVGHSLRDAGLALTHDPRYSSPKNDPIPPDMITMHLSQGTGNFDPQWMHDCHKEHANG